MLLCNLIIFTKCIGIHPTHLDLHPVFSAEHAGHQWQRTHHDPCINHKILVSAPGRAHKEKAAEIFTFQRLIFLDGVEGETSESVAANSSKSIKFSYLRTKTLRNL